MSVTPPLEGSATEASGPPVLLPAPGPRPPVCSFNEWDPLEEVIVGVLHGACVPAWDLGLEATLPEDRHAFYRENGGRPFPPEQVTAADCELDELARILHGEGVTVRRPDPVDFTRPYATPDWTSPGGLYAALPRDLLLVVGNLVIESPLSWRSRYYEIHAYRRLLKEYFLGGARWISAPRPELKDDLYDAEYDPVRRGRFVTNEWEPVFDGADFLRCGRDLFVQRSHVTNWMGIEWVSRQLGDDYQVHELTFNDPRPVRIDATLMPLAPGKLLINPERVTDVPERFQDWDVRLAPSPNLGVLMLDPERVIVEQEDEPMIQALRAFGLKPIPCPFANVKAFGGTLHAATADVRRKGMLEGYF